MAALGVLACGTTDSTELRDAGARSEPLDSGRPHSPDREAESAPPPVTVTAGFVEIEPVAFKNGYERPRAGEARLFYSLIPAREAPEDRPLFVFFNGGPGYNTSGLLHAFGTGPLTVDDAGEVVSNPNNFTELGSLLYIDARNTGFSYNLAEDPSSEVERERGVSTRFFNPSRDAADFVRVLLRILQQNPALRDNPVVLVGESYGSHRAVFMTEYLLHPERLGAEAAPSSPSGPDRDSAVAAETLELNPRTHYPHRDPALAAEILEHYEAAFPGEPPLAAARRQFGARVFIQPVYGIELRPRPPYDWDRVLNDCTQGAPMQRAAQLRGEHCPLAWGAYDHGHLAKPRGWVEAMEKAGIDTMMTPSGFEQRFGVHPSQVVGLTGEERFGAFRFSSLSGYHGGERVAEPLQQALGRLEPWDQYFLRAAPNSFDFDSRIDILRSLSLFLEQAPWVKTLITDAAFDLRGPSTAVVDSIEALSAEQGLDVVARHHNNPENGEERPGWLEIEYGPSWALPPDRRHVRIRMPRYELSAHVVTMTEGPELMADVRSFLSL